MSSIKQVINDGLSTGLQWTVVVGTVKLFIESYLFYYFKKKKSLGHGILFSLATNLLSSIFMFILLTPFVQLFRTIATAIKPLSSCFTESYIFCPYGIFAIWLVNIVCGLILNKFLKIHLSLKQLLIIFTSSSVGSIALSILGFQLYPPKK